MFSINQVDLPIAPPGVLDPMGFQTGVKALEAADVEVMVGGALLHWGV